MAKSLKKGGYPDFHQHLQNLDEAGLLTTIDEPVNKDTQLHPLVRWQFRGGIPEEERKAFKFTNVTDSLGRSYNMPVVVGALSTNAAMYSIGMGVPIEEIGNKWNEAIANPIDPVTVDYAPCHEVNIAGEDLKGEGKGLDSLPVPISTPGYDSAPYLTATNVTTRNPETGTQNMGTYRAGLKASDRLAVRMVSRPGGAEGHMHWELYKERGEKMPCAIVVGCPHRSLIWVPKNFQSGSMRLGLPVVLSANLYARFIAKQSMSWFPQNLRSFLKALSIRNTWSLKPHLLRVTAMSP